MKSSLWRKVAAAAIVAAGLGYVVGMYLIGLSDKNAADRDFISYWAAGRQLAHGANPYDILAVRTLEVAAGRDPNEALLMMRNPPEALFLALPLGLVSPKTGLILWLLVLLGSLSVSIWILWLLHGRSDSRLHLIGYIFAPALTCLMACEVGIFLLLGLVLFLYFNHSRPFFGGAALLLCALKPHLFLPFAAVLLAWAIYRGRYRILAGFLIALTASCALSFFFDHHAWADYFLMMRVGGAVNEDVPVLSVGLRNLLDRHATWLQFLPQSCACAWALWYFRTRREQWKWMDHGLLVLAVSAMCTPFGWFTDESMLLPVVLAGLYQAVEKRRSVLPLGLILGVALIEVFANVQIISWFYLWTTPAWLAWYLYATGRIAARSPMNERVDTV